MATYRSEEAVDLAAVRDAPACRHVELERLDADALDALVAGMLGVVAPPVELSRFLVEHSEGNPFFVAEYLRMAVEERLLSRDDRGRWRIVLPGRERLDELPLPHTLRDLVARRLRALPPVARGVAEAASVLGREIHEGMLAAISRTADADLSDALHQLVVRQVMEEVEAPRLRFAHDKVREVVYEAMDPDRRRALHLEAATFLDTHPERDGHLGMLGHHWEQAGRPEQALPCYLTGARLAASRYAHLDAENLYRAFLRLVPAPSAQRIVARGELADRVLALQGRNSDALKEYRRALREAQKLGSRSLEAEALRGMGGIERALGRRNEASDDYEQALAIFRELDDRASIGASLGDLALLCQELGRVEEARALYERSLEIHRDVGDRRREGVVLGNLALLLRERGLAAEARAACERALTLHRETRDRASEGRTLSSLAAFHEGEGAIEEARALYEAALAIHREVGDRGFEGITLASLGRLHLAQRRLPDARQLLSAALALHREASQRDLEGSVLSDLAALALDEGHADDARELAESALAIHREVGSRRLEASTLVTLARIHQEAGRSREAREVYNKALAAMRAVRRIGRGRARAR
ncbi:MAG: tetratricopeptide repeat protein [Acidobacteriota bacterium]